MMNLAITLCLLLSSFVCGEIYVLWDSWEVNSHSDVFYIDEYSSEVMVPYWPSMSVVGDFLVGESRYYGNTLLRLKDSSLYLMVPSIFEDQKMRVDIHYFDRYTRLTSPYIWVVRDGVVFDGGLLDWDLNSLDWEAGWSRNVYSFEMTKFDYLVLQINFGDVDYGAFYLDSVALTIVPEPATLFLLMVGGFMINKKIINL